MAEGKVDNFLESVSPQRPKYQVNDDNVDKSRGEDMDSNHIDRMENTDSIHERSDLKNSSPNSNVNEHLKSYNEKKDIEENREKHDKNNRELEAFKEKKRELTERLKVLQERRQNEGKQLVQKVAQINVLSKEYKNLNNDTIKTDHEFNG